MQQNGNNLVTWTCPLCNGVLQAVNNGYYQCQLGHLYSMQELINKQRQVIDKELWTLYRSLLQQTEMIVQLLQQEPALGQWVDEHMTDSQAAAQLVLKLLQRQK